MLKKIFIIALTISVAAFLGNVLIAGSNCGGTKSTSADKASTSCSSGDMKSSDMKTSADVKVHNNVLIAGSDCGGMKSTSADKASGSCCPSDMKTSADAKMQNKDIKSAAVMPIANVVKTEGEAVVIKDVISGDMITVKDDTPSMDYEGKRYYFSCNGCKSTFSKDPSKYASIKVEPTKSESKGY